MNYVQCVLEKKSNLSTETIVTYIPQKYASVNNRIKIQDPSTKKWSDEFNVVYIGVSIDEKDISDVKSIVKKHRKNTGDSLPKNEK